MQISLFKIILPVLLAPICLFAQTPPQIPPPQQVQLQVPQPPVDTTPPENISVSAEFDPPVVRLGGKTFYRVTIGATESSIAWPEKIAAPAELKFGAKARGQLSEFLGTKFHPTTAFLYEVRAETAGHFLITNFTVEAYGRPVEIPAARVDVVESNPVPPPRQLLLEAAETNVFLGQPFHVRVLLPAGPGNAIEALRDVQFDGNGLIIGRTSARESVAPVNLHGQNTAAFIHEATVTPIAAGSLEFFAQAFTAGREFTGGIMIQGQVVLPGGQPKYVLLVSDAVAVNVRPLPTEGELPGFTGAMGKFTAEKIQLSTSRVRIGEPVQLKFGFQGDGDLTRFVPPQPRQSRGWQIIAGKPGENEFTLIPLTDEATSTPAIPFCAFDPTAEKFYDLTIPPQPITVTGESLPVEFSTPDEAGEKSAPLKLSSLAVAAGKTASLTPPQLHGWLVGAQFVPVIGLLALWRWDCRRKFLEAHPEIVRRRKAKRDLRRERIKLRDAIAAGNAEKFAEHAAAAMRIAVAPHFPAHPQALVCTDVLTQLDPTEQNGRAGEIVRKIFTAADAQFAATPQAKTDLLSLKSGAEIVLQNLGEKL
jgi:hypothetical protein